MQLRRVGTAVQPLTNSRDLCVRVSGKEEEEEEEEVLLTAYNK